MASIRRISGRIAGLFYRGRIEREIEEELNFHLRMRVEENIRRGQSLEEAQQNARRAFGNVEVIKEESRDVRGGGLMESCLRDLRFGWRILAKRKASTVFVTIILALGIGGSAAIFSDVTTTLFWKLPYFESDRLVRLAQKTGEASELAIPPEIVQDWSAKNSVFTAIAAYQFQQANLRIGREAYPIKAEGVSKNFFAVLGLPILLGRDFQAEDEALNAPAVCILEDGFWRRQFRADRGIIGTTINLNGEPSVVIGVVSLNQPSTDDIFIPIKTNRASERHSNSGPYGVGRLKPGISVAEANAEINKLWRSHSPPDKAPDTSITVNPLRHDLTGGGIGPVESVILLAAILLLIVACANASDSLLVYGARRANEFVVRMALGAGRSRIIRQLVSENVTLLAFGTTMGAVIAVVITTLLRHSFLHHGSSVTHVARTVSVDWNVFVSTCVFAFLTVTFTSVVSGVPISNRTLAEGLRFSGRRMTLEHRNQGVRSTLGIFQIAISLVLLFGALCSLKSFRARDVRDPGFEPSGVFEIEVPFAFAGRREALRSLEQLLSKLKTVPGITGAAYSTNGLADVMTCQYKIDNKPPSPVHEERFAALSITNSGYLEMMKSRFATGSFFTGKTNQGNIASSVIDENLARKEFPGLDPTGHSLMIRFAGEELATQIVGVVQSLNQYGVENPTLPSPQIYISISEVPPGFAEVALTQIKLFVRTNKALSELEPAIKRTIQTMDRDQSSPQLQSVERLLSGTRGQRTYKLFVLVSFGTLSLLLTGASVYSLVNHTITQRVREIAIRMALGAPALKIYELIAAKTAWLLIAGLGIGIGLTVVINNLLIWQSGTDSAVRGMMVIAFLLTVAVTASSYFSIRRSISIDPNEVLRSE
jgi:predicted permease